jgi:peptidoglycan/xylan/chitin deacetylase (PgdA/CDA1 family)
MYFSNKKEVSFPIVALSVLLMVLISGYFMFQLIPQNFNFSFFSKFEKKHYSIYILKSEETENFLNSYNNSASIYDDNIKRLYKKFASIGIKPKIISENQIKNLTPNDILFAPDTYKISQNTLHNIENFLKRGGNLIFNYHFGYFNGLNGFVGPKTIETITKLKFITESIPKTDSNFYTPKVLSPIEKSSKKAQRWDLVLYSRDHVPIFQSNYTPDAILTNWEVTSTPLLNGKMLKVNQAGVIWHGFYKKGKWFYFSFPAYVFLDMPKKHFKRYIQNIISYMKNPITVVPYPFIDTKKAVFISEDTEYMYPYMYHFATLAHKHDINVTLFCVAKLAQKYPQLTIKASKLPNVEIASHSYSHCMIIGEPIKIVKREIVYSKEVLEKIIGKPIYGFRPPREQIDKNMEIWLRKAGYIYVMEKTKSFLLPREEYKHLIDIPRHGTDDYIYLVNLNWNKKQILHKIIQETNMLTSLNALYTLSVHTHLLSYKTNISVENKYFTYLNKHPDIKALKGIDLAKRAIWLKHIKITQNKIGNMLTINITNNNDVKINNFSFRVYWPNIKIVSITPELLNIKLTKICQNNKRRYSDYRIKTLMPKSTISLIVKFKND